MSRWLSPSLRVGAVREDGKQRERLAGRLRTDASALLLSPASTRGALGSSTFVLSMSLKPLQPSPAQIELRQRLQAVLTLNSAFVVEVGGLGSQAWSVSIVLSHRRFVTVLTCPSSVR